MKKSILLILLLLITNNAAFGQRYWEVLRTAVSRNNEDYRAFGWVTYPTNNNGILSMGRSRRARFGLGDNICPTFTCLGLSETLIDTPEGINVSSFVTKNIGESSSLNEVETKRLVIDSTLPHFLKIIGINFNLSRERTVKIDFSFGSLMMREILPAEVIGYFNSIESNPNATLTQRAISRAYRQRNLSIITKDLVIEKMRFSVEVDIERDLEVKAELDQKVGKVFGTDSTMKVEVSKSGNSKYEIETTRPLIIARYYQNAKDLED